MRKRSSENLIWVAWASILLAAIAVAGVFNVTQISLVERQDVRFMNLRFPVLEDFRERPELAAGDSELSGTTPLLFVGVDSVLVGTLQEIVSPDRGADILLLKRSEWKETIEEKLEKWLAGKRLMTVRSVALAFESDSESAEVLSSIQFVKGVLVNVNRKLATDSVDFEPMVTIINMGQLKVASMTSGKAP
jgi:hypothetical protein